jgi:hypothetical protein
MHRKVVSRALANHPEAVHECETGLTVLERDLETVQGASGRVVLKTRNLTHSANALGLNVEMAAHVVAVDRERN